MTGSAGLEPTTDEALREYGQRMRVSVRARATVLDGERRKLESDLQRLRSRAAGKRG